MAANRGGLALALATAMLLGLASAALCADQEPRVSLDLRQASVDSALRMLFKDTPYSYTLAPGVSGEVTLALNDVTFPQALNAILEPNDLTYVKEPGDIYRISPRPSESAVLLPAVPPASPEPAGTTPAPGEQWFLIGLGGRYQLQYLDCRDVAQWFGGQVVPGTPMIPMPIGGGSGIGARPSAAPTTGHSSTGLTSLLGGTGQVSTSR